MILVSIIAYKERDLAGTVRDCWDKAIDKDNIYFSIVEEYEEFSDLSFIPVTQITHQKYDTSEYRGILWARKKTTEIDVNYDYVLYICGHTRFLAGWDETCLSKYDLITRDIQDQRVIITNHGPVYEINEDFSINTDPGYGFGHNTSYFPSWDITKDHNIPFAPGYWFPKPELVPKTPYTEHYWLCFTWLFSSRQYVEEFPLDPAISWNVEEPYSSIISSIRGYRFFAIPDIIYYHHTVRKYPDKDLADNSTSRPWVDDKKQKYREHADESLKRLNLLLSGNYQDISIDQILDFCRKSKLNPMWTKFDENYHLLDGYQNIQIGK